MEDRTRDDPNRIITIGQTRRGKRWPYSIRFLDPERERIKVFADVHGLVGSEFVRLATLAAIESDDDSVARRTPPIKMTFWGTHILATRVRQKMLDADEENELKDMVVMVSEVQDELLAGSSD